MPDHFSLVHIALGEYHCYLLLSQIFVLNVHNRFVEVGIELLTALGLDLLNTDLGKDISCLSAQKLDAFDNLVYRVLVSAFCSLNGTVDIVENGKELLCDIRDSIGVKILFLLQLKSYHN